MNKKKTPTPTLACSAKKIVREIITKKKASLPY
jgi:hypothetical protein